MTPAPSEEELNSDETLPIVERSLSPDDELRKSIISNLAEQMFDFGISLDSKILLEDSFLIIKILDLAEILYKKQPIDKKNPNSFVEVISIVAQDVIRETEKNKEAQDLLLFSIQGAEETFDAKKIGPLTDALTQLSTRATLPKTFKEFNAGSRKEDKNNKPFSLIMIDIDLFKEINDVYGHATGDIVLQELTRILKETFRAEDKIFRIGGDEFLILAKGTSDETKKALERLFEKIKITPIQIPYSPYREENDPITISVSAGSVSSEKMPEKENSLNLFKAEADRALYEAKNGGRGQFAQIAEVDA